MKIGYWPIVLKDSVSRQKPALSRERIESPVGNEAS
jgi:hypothetical protein